jgi:hypothetical protein
VKLTPGERRAAWCLVPVIATFLPPVTTWAASVGARPFGVPFLVFWNALSVAMTVVWIGLALRLKARRDEGPLRTGNEPTRGTDPP